MVTDLPLTETSTISPDDSLPTKRVAPIPVSLASVSAMGTHLHLNYSYP